MTARDMAAVPESAEEAGDAERHQRGYLSLQSQAQAEGLLRPDTWGYVLKFALVAPGYFFGWWALLHAEDWRAGAALALLVGFVSIQSAGIAHEAGHGAVSKSRYVTRAVGQLTMTLLMGSSFTSWLDKHRRHHNHANTEQDPDMRSGLFSFTDSAARDAQGLGKWLTRYQPILIWPLSTLMGFAFKINSLIFLAKNPRKTRLDQALLLAHVVFWIAVPWHVRGPASALGNYLLITWVEGAYLATIFITNHLGHPVPPREWARSYLGRQAAAARNLPDNWFIRHFFLGLNSHIEHHLFASVSFTRLHRARAMTRRCCESLGVPYHRVGMLEAFAEVQRFHRRMADCVRSSSARGPEASLSPGTNGPLER
jgi:fatty acid desaturase